jgi:hypothetical protein
VKYISLVWGVHGAMQAAKKKKTEVAGGKIE